jgi:hypothetical protein
MIDENKLSRTCKKRDNLQNERKHLKSMHAIRGWYLKYVRISKNSVAKKQNNNLNLKMGNRSKYTLLKRHTIETCKILNITNYKGIAS